MNTGAPNLLAGIRHHDGTTVEHAAFTTLGRMGISSLNWPGAFTPFGVRPFLGKRGGSTIVPRRTKFHSGKQRTVFP